MRLFSFGCSLTRYMWPTWADIIARQIGADYQNWGDSGLGNVAILNRFLQCDVANKFTSDDLVLVMWSSAMREDRYLNGSWTQYGNIYSQDFFDRKFMSKYWSDEDGMLKTLNAMTAVNRLIRSRSYVTAMCPIENLDGYGNHEFSSSLSRMIDFYRDELPTTTDLFTALNRQWTWTKRWEDGSHDYHPLPSAHLAFVEQHVAPQLGIEIGPEVREWATAWDDVVLATRTVAEMRALWCASEPRGGIK